MNKFKFEVKSGEVNLTDPCYNEKTWCGDYHVPALNGEWTVVVRESKARPGRPSGFTAYCRGHSKAHLVHDDTDYGVDSGQFGIFDCEIYDGDSKYEEPGFYRNICDMTLENSLGGVVSNQGFASSTTWGDGSYRGKRAVNEKGELVKFSISFS